MKTDQMKAVFFIACSILSSLYNGSRLPSLLLGRDRWAGGGEENFRREEERPGEP